MVYLINFCKLQESYSNIYLLFNFINVLRRVKNYFQEQFHVNQYFEGHSWVSIIIS